MQQGGFERLWQKEHGYADKRNMNSLTRRRECDRCTRPISFPKGVGGQTRVDT